MCWLAIFTLSISHIQTKIIKLPFDLSGQKQVFSLKISSLEYNPTHTHVYVCCVGVVKKLFFKSKQNSFHFETLVLIKSSKVAFYSKFSTPTPPTPTKRFDYFVIEHSCQFKFISSLYHHVY